MSDSLQALAADCNEIPVTNDVGDCSQHVLDAEARDAINAALAINRPLLIWGEPGIGKSQLAKAAAAELQRVFLPFVADAHTESRDLLWSLDAVARLAEAQIQSSDNPDRNAVALEKFIVPGVLWWALNWKNADDFVRDGNGKQRFPVPAFAKLASPNNGSVVLIDEIDKADSSVPNGLLEALGSNRFHPQGLSKAIEAQGARPLVIVTTNNERSLPDAFVRRCLSLHLSFPQGEDEQRKFLMKRAKANFAMLDAETVRKPAIDMLIEDRTHAVANNLRPLPGVAELFDLLRGVKNLQQQQSVTNIDKLMQQLRRFTYQKHPQHQREPYQA